MDTKALEKVGFTHGEIKVYLALLSLGTVSAGPLVKEAEVARSKLYEIINRLAKKGMASHFMRNGVKYFSAAPPSRLLDFLRKKEEDIEANYQEVKKLVPELEGEYQVEHLGQEAEVFEGLEGLKNGREKMLRDMKSGDETYYFGVPLSAYDKMERYYREWNSRRIKKKIIAYTLFTDDARDYPYVKEKLKHRHTLVRFLPKGVRTYAWAEIYGDTVVIVMNYKKPMSIMITNKYVAESYKQYFHILWNASSE
ncbi:HTH-type sugar sensing transcriptional regulator TrmBL1 [Candidatus Gugararchaeum adminiculabundum]|nr:HTH-type sugar sensing transcriptional regulator TrmBL1 [Candidatus Gugararchaeum adminiculabundum]